MFNFLEKLPSEYVGVILAAVGFGVVLLIVLAGFWTLFSKGILKMPSSAKVCTAGLTSKINEVKRNTDRKICRMDADVAGIRTKCQEAADKFETKIDNQRVHHSRDIRRLHEKIEAEKLNYVPLAQCTICSASQKSSTENIAGRMDDFKVEVRDDIQGLTKAVNRLMEITP